MNGGLKNRLNSKCSVIFRTQKLRNPLEGFLDGWALKLENMLHIIPILPNTKFCSSTPCGTYFKVL